MIKNMNDNKTRYISFDINFDVNCWARWAEAEGIDNRGINFVLTYPEILNKEGGVQTVNARSLVTFFNTISGFENFENNKSLAMIMDIASGCFTSKENVVGNLFTTFIANRLDKLVSPHDLINMKWKVLKPRLEECLYEDGKYRADVASVLTTRFINYTNVAFEKKTIESGVVCDRILDFIENAEKENGKTIFTEDLTFNLIKTLVVNHKTRMSKLLKNPKIAKKLL